MGPDVDFSQCLIFNVESMIDDKVINKSSELFEAIIQYSRLASGSPSAYQLSNRKGGEQLLDATIETVLTFLPTPAQSIWKKGKHYAIRNILR